MPEGQLQGVVHYLRRVVAPDGMGGVSDAELLERFVRQRDEAAFELLVWRHGEMVLGVCRRLLHHEQDAEDAFQAAFLALARRASALGRRESVGGWLYRVASRIALRARADSCRRSQREQTRPVQPNHVADPAEEAAGHELRRVIDEEVNRLPAKYRVPFVLCHLGGHSNAEVARELGCPVGTVESWLARARRRLRGGLARRGVVLPAGLFAAEWTALTAPGEVSAALAGTAARAAVLVMTGGATVGLISVQATAWAEGALRTMYVSKLKIAAVVLLSVGLAGTGVGRLGYFNLGAEEPGSAKEVTSAPKKGEADRIGRLIRQLGSERFAEREKALKELDKIGLPALEALQEAAQAADPEVRRRAAELANKIEQQQESEALLRAQRVHLRYKDTPLYEALRDFQEKCGFPLSVQDTDGKLKKRTITLDTGDVTFWDALDQFCKAAGLVEAGRTDLPQAARPMMPPAGLPGGGMPRLPGNPGRLIPGAGVPALPGAPAAPGGQPGLPPGVQPAPAPALPAPGQVVPPPVAPAATPPLPGRPLRRAPGQAPAPPAPGQPAPGQPTPQPGATPALPAAPGGPPGRAIPAPAAPALPGMPGLPPGAMPGIQLQPGAGIHKGSPQEGSILLREGKPRDLPTALVGAFRLRLLDRGFGPTETENYLFVLQVAAEPKVGWRQATALHIDKAVDDRGQILTEAPAAATRHIYRTDGDIPATGDLLPFRLKKGEKPAKSLKELKGKITAEVLSRPKTILTVEDLLKADEKEFKIPKEGSWKIEAKHVANEIRVTIESPELPDSVGRSAFHMSLEFGTKGSKQQRKIKWNLASSESTPLMRQTCHIGLAKGESIDEKTLRVELRRQRVVTVTIPFAFKDVPLPQ